MISAAGQALTRLFDLILLPARGAAPVWGIALAALLTAAGVLISYRLVSDQDAIRRLKKRVQGHLLGIYLYRDDPRAMLGSLGRVWSNSMRYLAYSLVPFAVAFVPVALVCLQLDLRYAHRPLRPGERMTVSVELDPSAPPPALSSTGGLQIETAPLAIGGTGETNWRVRAVAQGAQAVTVAVGEETLALPVAVGGAARPLCRRRLRSPVRQGLLCPAGDPIPRGSAVRAVRVSYPPERVRLAGMRLHWSASFFVLALAFGLLLKRPFGVDF
ncbi:MAG TPA: hypothetical protein PK696_04045 [bacterium]|nr:hypothetical protein [Chlamydiota bacterium]HOE26849.1 hypothetical protein [bacterium]HQM52199.1 hypothetical protein [bacterium]